MEKYIPDCWIYKTNDYVFYHIDFPEEEFSEGLCNFVDEFGISRFKVISGKIGWTLRFGGKNNIEIFIENNRNSHNTNKVEVRNANRNSIGKHFIEQYFSVPYGIYFTKKCMVVFEQILLKKELGEEVNKKEFEEITKEVFGNDKSI